MFLCSAAKRLAQSLDLEDTLRCIADLCVPELGQACIVYLFDRDGKGGRIAASKHADSACEALLDSLAQRAFGAQPDYHHPLLQVAATRQALVLSPLQTAALIGDGRPAHVLQRDLHLKTAVLVPLVEAEHALGIAVCLADSTSGYTPRQVCIVRELSEQFALALSAAQKYTACKATLDATQEILATTVHDLMSPLTYIKGSGHQLRRLDWSRVDPTIRTDFARRWSAIDAAVNRMALALSALMESTRSDPTKVSRGRSVASIDLLALVRDVVGLEQLVAPEHSIRLTCESKAEPLSGNWSADQVQRMLANLISNAVKYSPPGGCVEIQLMSEVNTEGRWAVVRVVDEGIGIPPGDLPFVWEPFHRGSNVGEVPGTGLGLASVWQTVRTHAGRLRIESQEGAGTSVTVSLPLASAEAGAGQ